jgi:hypothetical protein
MHLRRVEKMLEASKKELVGLELETSTLSPA